MSLKDVIGIVDSAGNAVDKNFESGEERSKELSSRHQTDMQSDSFLSKNIRPMTLIFLMICELAIIVAAIMGITIDIAITSQVGVLLFGAFSFYFNSKKAERVADKNASANMEMKKMELKAQIKADRRAKRKE